MCGGLYALVADQIIAEQKITRIKYAVVNTKMMKKRQTICHDIQWKLKNKFIKNNNKKYENF